MKESIKAEDFKFEVGDQLTIRGEIISQSGYSIFNPGDKVTIQDIPIHKGYWSRLCPDIWVPDTVMCVKLMEEDGNWKLGAFVEFQELLSER